MTSRSINIQTCPKPLYNEVVQCTYVCAALKTTRAQDQILEISTRWNGGWITRLRAALWSNMIGKRRLARHRSLLPPPFVEDPKRRGGNGHLCLMLVTPMLAVIAMLLLTETSSRSKPCKNDVKVHQNQSGNQQS